MQGREKEREGGRKEEEGGGAVGKKPGVDHR